MKQKGYIAEGQIILEGSLVPIRREHGDLPLAIRDPADVRDVGLPHQI